MRPEESLFIIFVRNRNSDNFRGEVPIVAGNSGVSGSVRRLSTRLPQLQTARHCLWHGYLSFGMALYILATHVVIKCIHSAF